MLLIPEFRGSRVAILTADLRRDPQPLIYAPSDIPPFIISLKMQNEDILHLEIS